MNTSDEAILVERLDQLQKEKDELKQIVSQLSFKLLVTTALLVLSCVLMICEMLFTETKHPSVTYCYTSTYFSETHLFGDVKWWFDRDFGRVANIADGLQVAKLMGCQFYPTEDGKQ